MITELACQLRHSEVTSVELITRALTALETVVDDHHGLAAALRQRAMSGAEVADRARARAAIASTNPLLGIPFAVEDSFAAAGRRRPGARRSFGTSSSTRTPGSSIGWRSRAVC